MNPRHRGAPARLLARRSTLPYLNLHFSKNFARLARVAIAVPLLVVAGASACWNPVSTSLNSSPTDILPANLAKRGLISMAWRSTGSTNEELIENMWKSKLITQPKVKEAFLKVDRAHYTPHRPYEDSPQGIGHGATISAPHMHAAAAEHLLPALLPTATTPAPRVLDVGSGSGYLTHVLAELAGPGGRVVGLEHLPALRDLGEANMARGADGRRLLDEGRVRFVVGDGRLGWREEGGAGEAGWDAIHVGASAKTLHGELLEQLRAPGRMFIPVDDDEGGWDQHVWLVEKDGAGTVRKTRLFGVRYVPLVDPAKGAYGGGL